MPATAQNLGGIQLATGLASNEVAVETVEHLLAHRSGIGDYFDEDVFSDFTDYVLPVPVHELASTEDYLAVLAGHPARFAPGYREMTLAAIELMRVAGILFPGNKVRVKPPATRRGSRSTRAPPVCPTRLSYNDSSMRPARHSTVVSR